MDVEKLIEQYRQAADKWEKRNPVTDTFDLRVQDALRDAATALSTLQVENEKLRADLENYRKDHCSEGGCAAEKDRDAVLAELVQADREGRCVVLPCKLHDKVFFIENGCVKETEVDSFHNRTSGRWKIFTHTDRMYEHWKGYEIDFSGIGKTVFLSREEAEKALEEMEENRNG